MEPNTAIAISLEDMIFEGRNKAYGAYVLRKIYHQHLSQALLYAIGFFVLLFSAPVIANLLAGKKNSIQQSTGCTITMTRVVLPPVKEVTPEKASEPAAAKATAPTVKNTTPKVVDNQTPVVDDIPTQEDLQKANSGLTTSQGDGETEIGNPLPGEGTGGGNSTGSGEPTAAATQIFISAEHMPEFEGGMKKLMAYLGKNIRYPKAAQAQGVEGTVVLSFVVSVTGEINDVQVLKGLGYGTEEEAVRVVEKMPRWKPGSQNGRAVPVRMTLPIRLKLK
ncbi:hypothetical protein TH63_12155 [Rufibacter radiotolerans]|uniref:TonB C-terminal domain-containing protein n=1 Tax=Rufibacter radiotolerans TaxID=1379910 RepID=A0A0H4VR35_9BACT|nr:energy transducer TonB [Rufibacter radiotolerans]AKQ46204.1 hypothetical protein TH63_12155 [Rufibacter radiotolerans]